MPPPPVKAKFTTCLESRNILHYKNCLLKIFLIFKKEWLLMVEWRRKSDFKHFKHFEENIGLQNYSSTRVPHYRTLQGCRKKYKLSGAKLLYEPVCPSLTLAVSP